MHKLWLIIKREYVTRVKTKGFVIGTVIVPLIGIGFTLLIVFLVSHQSRQSLRLVIVDNAGGIAPSVAAGLQTKMRRRNARFNVVNSIDRPASLAAAQDDLRAKINSGALDAYLVIPDELSQACRASHQESRKFLAARSDSPPL